MENLFLDYQTSVELKKLGYDEQCFAYYYRKDFLYWIKDSKSQYDGCKNEYFNNVEIACPLIQQVFQWFRKQHQIVCNINQDWECGVFYGFEGCIETMKGDLICCTELFNTYEEAELACVKELITSINKQ